MPLDKYEPPKETRGDIAHAAGRGLFGGIPFAGQTAIEMFNMIITPPIEKRRDEWRQAIAEGLCELEQKHLCVVEQLSENDVFIDTVIQASTAAIRTSHQEKREALRNAVLNSALTGAPDDSRQSMFIWFIDTLSPLHLRILSLLDDPSTRFPIDARKQQLAQPKTLWPLVAAAYPEFASEEALCERVCRELNDRGLLIATSLRKNVNRFPYDSEKTREQQVGYRFADELPSDMGVSYSGTPTAYRHWTTDIGREFIAFISAPPEVAA